MSLPIPTWSRSLSQNPPKDPNAEMRLIGRRFVAAGSFISFERLHYLAGDADHAVRDVVRHPGAVVVVPIKDGEIIMIRQQRVALGRELLELPAGKLDDADHDPEDTARRECSEEIGYRPHKLSLMYTYFSSPGFSDERMWLYLATELEQTQMTPQGAEERAAEIVSLPVGEAIGMVERGEIEDAKTILGLLALERMPH